MIALSKFELLDELVIFVALTLTIMDVRYRFMVFENEEELHNNK